MEIAKKRCDQCLFSDARIVTEARAAQILRECAREDTHFICHKFTLADRGSNVMCAGHYDAVIEGVLPAPKLLRFAQAINNVRRVEFPAQTTGAKPDKGGAK